MSGRFANLKSIQLDDPDERDGGPANEPERGTDDTPTPRASAEPAARAARKPTKPTAPAVPGTTDEPARAVRPWEASPDAPVEPTKALNGRVPRSVRLAFDRQLTDAMDTLRMDVTVDLAVEALARLVIEDDDARERWMHKLWELKRGRRG